MFQSGSCLSSSRLQCKPTSRCPSRGPHISSCHTLFLKCQGVRQWLRRQGPLSQMPSSLEASHSHANLGASPEGFRPLGRINHMNPILAKWKRRWQEIKDLLPSAPPSPRWRELGCSTPKCLPGIPTNPCACKCDGKNHGKDREDNCNNQEPTQTQGESSNGCTETR